MKQLQPFAPTPSTAAFQLLCDIDLRGDVLELRYSILGPIDELALPMTEVTPQFRDELWTTTCLEIFLQEPEQSAYEEWNFSPSGNWACYHFESYRQPSSRTGPLQPLEPLLWIRNDHRLLLHAKIPVHQNFTSSRRDLRYGLTAVLHLTTGEKQYWALHHAGERPDFHRQESFVGEAVRSKDGRA